MGDSWNIYREPDHDTKSPLRVHLFCSRNKDNKGIDGFARRRRAFIAHDSDIDATKAAFAAFVADGVAGECCRWYESVNARDPEAVRRQLIHRLVDGADVTRLQSLAASVAAKRECATEKRWLFDFDDRSSIRVAHFTCDVMAAGGFASDEIERHATPNGFAVVVPHGFDTRDLLAQWDRVELKRDDLLLRKWTETPA